nr:MAG TPA: hypothetical protein [Caudoviricetes sp.]
MTIDLVSNSCIISLDNRQQAVFHFFHEAPHCVAFASGNNFLFLVRLLDANFISFYFNGGHVKFLSGFRLSHLFLVSIGYYKFTYISRWDIPQ